jgi:secreted trypsin-like serine protease
MSTTLLRRAITSAAVGFIAARAIPVLAITGGMSVDEVLASQAGSRYSGQQVKIAHAVSAVTVALFNIDASGRSASLCSATIVHPRVVLTAAHCVLDGRKVSRRMTVRFEGGASRRQVLDAVVHPGFLKLIRSRAYKPESHSLQQFMKAIEPSSMATDLAVVLLHRQIPETHDVVAPVARGFRDSRTSTKLIAGFGRLDGYQPLEKLALHFAELRGNSRLDEGALGGEGEIPMESRYRDGARVNTCDGDSGGPVFVLDRGTSRLSQLAVTSAGDRHCREAAVFAPIDGQRGVLREMFDALMRGEQGADQNPF